MTTGPSGEARATSSPPHGPPAVSDRPGDSPAGGSPSQGPLPGAPSTAYGNAASEEHQGVELEPNSPSGDKDKNEAAEGGSQEGPGEASLLPQDPRRDRLAEHSSVTQSSLASPGDTQGQEGMAQEASVAEGQQEAAQAETLLLGTSDPSIAAQNGTGAPKAASPASEADSMFPSPGQLRGSMGTWPLDPSLYEADEQNDYMQSMTSLLGRGEGTIGPLSDILVWPEATVGVGRALGLLATGHSSPSDLLLGTGPGLHSVSSLLRNASAGFSGLVASTVSALRSVTQVLGTMERRTRESICAAMCYLTGHFSRHRAMAGPSCG